MSYSMTISKNLFIMTYFFLWFLLSIVITTQLFLVVLVAGTDPSLLSFGDSPSLVTFDGTSTTLRSSSTHEGGGGGGKGIMGWISENYPHPDHDANICRTVLSYRFCDPDHVLSQDNGEIIQIEQYLNQTRYMPIAFCNKNKQQHQKNKDNGIISPVNHHVPWGRRSYGGSTSNVKKNGDLASDQDYLRNMMETSKIEIQMGVALVSKMDLSSYGILSSTSASTKAAESFAVHVHNTWGIGYNTPLCRSTSSIPVESGTTNMEATETTSRMTTTETDGTGVLLFLSLLDRTLYISRGTALDQVLTNTRLDGIIDRMRPKLQEGQYALAILDALQEMDHYILTSGPPDIWERSGDLIAAYGAMVIFLFIVASITCNIRYEQLRKRQYAKAASQLADIERQEAEALQGRFQTRSCPICLELFPKTESSTSSTESTSSMSSPKVGTDGKPVRLLRCGHVFDQSCFDGWVAVGYGTIDKCPICQQNLDKSNSSIGRPASAMMNSATTSTTATRTSTTTTTTSSSSTSMNVLRHRNGHGDSTTSSLQNSENRHDFGSTAQHQTPGTDSVSRVVRMFQQERNFRLYRLHDRYPRLIQRPMIERWTADTYHGSLVQDPAFTQLDPNRLVGDTTNGGSNNHRRRPQGRQSTSSSRSGFGGGSSGGGRGGHW